MCASVCILINTYEQTHILDVNLLPRTTDKERQLSGQDLGKTPRAELVFLQWKVSSELTETKDDVIVFDILLFTGHKFPKYFTFILEYKVLPYKICIGIEQIKHETVRCCNKRDVYCILFILSLTIGSKEHFCSTFPITIPRKTFCPLSSIHHISLTFSCIYMLLSPVYEAF